MSIDTVAAGPAVQVHAALTAALVAQVDELVDAAAQTDGVWPLSEHVSLHLRYGGEGPDRHLLLTAADGALLGYGHLDPTDLVAGAAVELVVHPAHRGHGFGRQLVEASAALVPRLRLRLWAHGDHPAARALAASAGFREGRRLEQWRRSLRSSLPGLTLPDGIRLRPFRAGQDDAAWLALNARAFAHHPEQGSWTTDDLHTRMREDWFDPAGFLLAEQESDGALVAFHWTKVHGGSRHGEGAAAHAHEPIGEVYVVGVDPDRQGRGLGRAVTIAGLLWLRRKGLAQAMLYVESDNVAARATYQALGFALWDTDVMFYRDADL